MNIENIGRLVAYEPDTGLLRWRVNASNRRAAGAVAGCKCKTSGYVLVRVDGRLHRAHRLIWLMVHGDFPALDVDHINGDRADNRLANLRLATRSENLQNMRRGRGESGLLGAHTCRGRWRSAIQVAGVSRNLGCFETAQEAHHAYLAVKQQVHPFQAIV